jgi:hypothetical protein
MQVLNSKKIIQGSVLKKNLIISLISIKTTIERSYFYENHQNQYLNFLKYQIHLNLLQISMDLRGILENIM